MIEKSISISVLDAANIPDYIINTKDIVEKFEENKVLKNHFNIIMHFDIMDGKFVPNTGIDLKYIKTAKSLGFYADTHLMVEEPIYEGYIQKAILNGTDCITIHFEIDNFEKVLNYLNEQKDILIKNENKRLDIGVAIKPNTNIEELIKYKDKFSKLLIMSVEPGFGGQKYIEDINIKIKLAMEKFKEHIIQLDGGVNITTISDAYICGADSFVIGTYLSKCDIKNEYYTLIALNSLKQLLDLPRNSNVDFDTKLLQILPGGYGEGDSLLGIKVPDTRKLANKLYKILPIENLTGFITSKYHEYRRFALFCMSNMIKSKKDVVDYKEVIDFFDKNIEYINNWDLTDEAGPNILGLYLLKIDMSKRKLKLEEYILNKNIWIKRIGIVSLLTLVRKNIFDLPLEIIDSVVYQSNHLLQKASRLGFKGNI
ncbi:MAG: DNA alkylation repair protein [Clostridia bacterium]